MGAPARGQLITSQAIVNWIQEVANELKRIGDNAYHRGKMPACSPPPGTHDYEVWQKYLGDYEPLTINNVYTSGGLVRAESLRRHTSFFARSTVEYGILGQLDNLSYDWAMLRSVLFQRRRFKYTNGGQIIFDEEETNKVSLQTYAFVDRQSYIDDAHEIKHRDFIHTGDIVTVDTINATLTRMIESWRELNKNPLVFKWNDCHANCHSNCHGSGGWR